MATRVCPSCGTENHGNVFCVSCKEPLRGVLSTPSGAMAVKFTQEQPKIKAGFFRRFAALAIDWLILSIFSDIIRFAYQLGKGTGSGTGLMDATTVFSIVIFLLYFTFLTGEGGQTLGKMILGIKVQCTDGSPIHYGRATIRTLGYFISFFFMTFLGFLWSLWDKKNQTWHDKIAGTIVIKI